MPRRRSLLSEADALRRERLYALSPRFSSIDLTCGAVYICLLADVPVYVGQTTMIARRIYEISRARRPPGYSDAARAYVDQDPSARPAWHDYIIVCPTDDEWLRLREASLIAWLRPRYNAYLQMERAYREHLYESLLIPRTQVSLLPDPAFEQEAETRRS